MGERHSVNRNIAIIMAAIFVVLIICLTETYLWATEKDDILNLNKSDVLSSSETVSEEAGTSTGKGFFDTVAYAGYFKVQVWTSTSNKTYLEIYYYAYAGVSYYNKISIGNNGTITFPVLPTRTVNVNIGNDEPVGTPIQNQTITITYYY